MGHSEEEASKLVLWISPDVHSNHGRRRMTYIDNLLQNTGLESVWDLQTFTQENRRNCVDSVVKHSERQRLDEMFLLGRLFDDGRIASIGKCIFLFISASAGDFPFGQFGFGVAL